MDHMHKQLLPPLMCDKFLTILMLTIMTRGRKQEKIQEPYTNKDDFRLKACIYLVFY